MTKGYLPRGVNAFNTIGVLNYTPCFYPIILFLKK